VRSLVTQLQSDRDTAHPGLDALPLGILFADSEGGVLHANVAARRLLEERDGLSLDRTGPRAATSAATSELRALCAACVASSIDATGHLSRPLLLPRPSGRASLQVLVCPNRLPETMTVTLARGAL